MTLSVLKTRYEKVKQECTSDWKSARTGNAILDLVGASLQFLNNRCKLITLVSRVPGKRYFTYKKGSVVARPANESFFLGNAATVATLWRLWKDDRVSAEDFTKLSYTVALAPCLAMELFDRQNKKGPATYFECYVGHLFSKVLGVNPTKRVKLVIGGSNVLMTMDFLFDVGDRNPKIHLPVKMSTRERVVQAWAHQRLLDSAHGMGAYRGIVVLFSETKLDSRSHEVVEICVPDQWLAYQSLLARMDRIYYFDLPDRYRALTTKYPSLITVKQFGEFFVERKVILGL